MPNNGYQQYEKFIFHGGAFRFIEFSIFQTKWIKQWDDINNNLYHLDETGTRKFDRLKTGTTNHDIWEGDNYIIKKFENKHADDYLQLKTWHEKSKNSNFPFTDFHPEIYYFEDEFVVMEKCDPVDVDKLNIEMITDKLKDLHEFGLFHGDILNGDQINTGNIVFRGNEMLFIDPSIPNKGNPEKEQTLEGEMKKLNDKVKIQYWGADLIEKQERKGKQDKKKK